MILVAAWAEHQGCRRQAVPEPLSASLRALVQAPGFV